LPKHPRHPNTASAIRQYFRDAAQLAEPDTWLAIPEFPTTEEIMAPDSEDAPPTNNLTGGWASKDEYLSTQYSLLREDAVSSLWHAVHLAKNSPRQSSQPLDNFIRIYTNVQVLGITCGPRGISVRVSFSIGLRTRWEQSKRLLSGSVVALSPASDWFRTKCIVAPVECRALEGLQQAHPFIDINFARLEDLELDPATE
jgi:helicase required for RNAi-mediated heterochromatin assembly 1